MSSTPTSDSISPTATALNTSTTPAVTPPADAPPSGDSPAPAQATAASPTAAEPCLLNATDDAITDRLMRAAVDAPGNRELTEADLDAQVAEMMAGSGLAAEDLTAGKLRGSRVRREASGQIHGKITRVTPDEVFVDLGGKSEGILPKIEFDDPDECQIGREVLVKLAGLDPKTGAVKLSRRAAVADAAWHDVKVGSMLEARVVGLNKGGLEVRCGEIRGFMPAGQSDIRHIPDLSVLLNQRLTVEVIKVDPGSREIVVSRRNVLLREREENRRRLLNEIQEGQLRTGTVRTLTEFGAFIDLGGVDGLLHISDISYGRVRRVEDVLKVGDTLEVKVLKVDRVRSGPSGSEKLKISLGLKQKSPDPWNGAAVKYPAGSRVRGIVVRLAGFGAFVELEPGVDGLLNVSEMSWVKRIRQPSELLSEGQAIEVSVLSVDEPARKITLSLRALQDNPWVRVAEKFPVGTVLTGKVSRTTDFGAFVELSDGIEGLVHISELDDKRVPTVASVAKVGQELKVKVLGIDVANQKVSLTSKPSVVNAAPPPPPPPSKTAEEIAADKAAAEAEAKRKAIDDAARAKKREKLRGGLGGGFGNLGGLSDKFGKGS